MLHSRLSFVTIDMQCTLYIPHLIPPIEIGDALWRTVDAPHLKTLLARAQYTARDGEDNDASLCKIFGVIRQQDWPLAPLLARGENLIAGHDQGYWLCATPIHLETRRNALILTDPAALAITATESKAFADMLVEHLHEEHVTLHAPQPGHWFLHCDTPPAMTTTPLGRVTGRDVRTFLPQGKDSARWHRILTEIQMLLHAHPANDAREARGLAPVNSVWLWGGGTVPPAGHAPYAKVYSGNATIRALANRGGCPIEDAPERLLPEMLSGSNSGAHFFSLELLIPLMHQGDLQTWSTTVTALEHDWFAPLAAALKSRHVSAATLISSNDATMQQFVMQPNDAYKFWRKNKYIE